MNVEGMSSLAMVINEAWSRADLSHIPRDWVKYRVAVLPAPQATYESSPPKLHQVETVDFARVTFRPHGGRLWQCVVGRYCGIEVMVEVAQL